MATSETARQSQLEGAAHGWGVSMTMGILLILGGTFALFASVLTSLVSIVYIGVMLLAVGIFEIVSAFRVRHTGPFLVYFLAGLLAIVVGGLVLYQPLASLASMTLLIAGYLFASGLFRGITAIVDRNPGWGWDFAYAIVAMALGAYIAAGWPLSSFTILGTIVAVEIIARGIALVAAASRLHEIARRIPAAVA